MKLVDIMPIIIVTVAILMNIALGVYNEIDFSILMIRCIIVTIVFGIFGYMITDTIKNVIEFSSLSKYSPEKEEGAYETEESTTNTENKSFMDIKVLPLDDEEFLSMDDDNNDGFVEVNPVNMRNYIKDEQD